MKKVITTFQSFMEEALKKSLPELSLQPSSAPDASQKIMQARLCFEGKSMRAQAFLSCTDDFLQMTCPLPKADDERHSVDTVIDWLGELGNLILGRLKNRLLAHDVTIKISAPDFAGNWTRPEKAETVAVWFECEGTLIGFDVVVEGRVPDIGEALPQSAEILPGDAIYRLNDTAQNAETVDLLSKIRSGVEDTAPSEEPMVKAERVEKRESSQHKPFPMHFHNAKDGVKKTASTLSIASVSWSSLNHFAVKFSNGLEATISPASLIEMGMSSFELEGFTIHFKSDGEILRVSIPKIHLTLSLNTRQAS